MNLRTLLVLILAVCFVAVCVLQAVAPINFGELGFARYMIFSAGVAAFAVAFGLYFRGRFGAGILGMGFLFEFALFATPINHFALWIHGPYIDGVLAHVDRAMGFDWPAMMHWFAAHPTLNRMLWVAYCLSTFQLLFVCIPLAWANDTRTIEQLCLATVIATVFTICMWTAFPSFGAVAVYGAPDHMFLVMDNAYTRGLLDLLARGPSAVSLVTTKGAVGFPSYHAVESVLACWYLRKYDRTFVAFLGLNALAFISMPVQGGHHLVDLFGGVAAAAASIALTARLDSYTLRGHVLARRLAPASSVSQPAMKEART